MDFSEIEFHDIARVESALLEAREKATETLAELSGLINRVDTKIAMLMQMKGHPPAMCDVIDQLSKNKKLDRRQQYNYAGDAAAVPAVVLAKKR